MWSYTHPIRPVTRIPATQTRKAILDSSGIFSFPMGWASEAFFLSDAEFDKFLENLLAPDAFPYLGESLAGGEFLQSGLSVIGTGFFVNSKHHSFLSI